jgi:hypothetical protein
MSKLFPGTEPVRPTFDHIQNVIKSGISSQNVPTSVEDMQEGVKTKIANLSKFWDINVTKKKQDKMLDYYCVDTLGLTGGYQHVLGVWNNANKEAISALELIKGLPESIYLSRCDCTEELFMLDPYQDVDISSDRRKRGFCNEFNVIVNSDDPEDNEYFSRIEKDVENALMYFALDEVVVSSGSGSSGFGNEGSDVTYISDQYGFTPLDSTINSYRLNTGDGNANMLMHLVRPDNEELDKIITILKSGTQTNKNQCSNKFKSELCKAKATALSMADSSALKGCLFLGIPDEEHYDDSNGEAETLATIASETMGCYFCTDKGFSECDADKAESLVLQHLLEKLPKTIKEMDGRPKCTSCEYEWGAGMIDDSNMPDYCACVTER